MLNSIFSPKTKQENIATKPLGRQVVYHVSIGLLAFSIIAGLITYSLVLKLELNQITSFEKQLVQTIRTQAAIGAYAKNDEIVLEVIEGLISTPYVKWAKISSVDNFSKQDGELSDRAQVTQYKLFSPIDNKQVIGELYLSIDYTWVEDKATRYAMSTASILIIQTLIAAIILLIFVYNKMGKPLMYLSSQITQIEAGSDSRIIIDAAHRDDEIGLVCQSANKYLEAAEEAILKAQELARKDPLTGLNNRRAFFELSENIYTQSKRYQWTYSIIMLDIDHFKNINDTYGHDIGDQALIACSSLILSLMREVDIVARIGGEEFAIIMPESTVNDAHILAERLRTRIAEHQIHIEQNTLTFTSSFGVAESSKGNDNIHLTLKYADEALYSAKENGRNRIEIYQNNKLVIT